MSIPPPLIVAVVILVLLAVAASVVRLIGRQRTAQIRANTYEAVPALLTPAERSFFAVLQQAVASDYQIFTKVRLADIVQPVRNPNRSGWQTAFNRIAGKHVDFVLCDSSHFGVVAVIELDDRTHEKLERGIRDSLVDSALTDARIPVWRVSARQSYSPPQIRAQVQGLFRSGEGATPNVGARSADGPSHGQRTFRKNLPRTRRTEAP